MEENTKYHEYDILRVFLLQHEKISRQDTAKKLELGEGSVRTILDHLKSRRLIESTTKGHQLTEKGKLLYRNLAESIEMKENINTNLFKGTKESAVLVKDPDLSLLPHIYKSRDCVIRQGAEDALLLMKNADRFVLPPIDFYEENFSAFEGLFEAEEKQMIVASYALDLKTAAYGAIAGALSLSKDLNTHYRDLTKVQG